MTQVELACMIVDDADYEHQLQVGHAQTPATNGKTHRHSA